MKLQIHFKRDGDGDYIVSDNCTVMYGSGETPRQALFDYISALIEYCYLLRDNARGCRMKYEVITGHVVGCYSSVEAVTYESMRDRAVAAHQAHNLEVGGPNPPPAMDGEV